MANRNVSTGSEVVSDAGIETTTGLGGKLRALTESAAKRTGLLLSTIVVGTGTATGVFAEDGKEGPATTPFKVAALEERDTTNGKVKVVLEDGTKVDAEIAEDTESGSGNTVLVGVQVDESRKLRPLSDFSEVLGGSYERVLAEVDPDGQDLLVQVLSAIEDSGTKKDKLAVRRVTSYFLAPSTKGFSKITEKFPGYGVSIASLSLQIESYGNKRIAIAIQSIEDSNQQSTEIKTHRLHLLEQLRALKQESQALQQQSQALEEESQALEEESQALDNRIVASTARLKIIEAAIADGEKILSMLEDMRDENLDLDNDDNLDNDDIGLEVELSSLQK